MDELDGRKAPASGCGCGATPAAAARSVVTPGKLGRCRTCILGSFGIAVAGWLAQIPVVSRPDPGLFAYVLLAIATGGTLLFGAHLGAMALRRIDRLGGGV